MTAPTAIQPNNSVFTRQQLAVLTIVLGTYMMTLLDTSIVITGLPQIRAELGFSPVTLSWVSTAYTLAFGGFLMLGARAGDMFGRRKVFLLGLSLFTCASLAIGLAPSAAALLAARAVQGLGAAILVPSTLALLQIKFSEGSQRTRALAAYAATAGIGSSLGLVLGGIFAGMMSWRVGFLINVPAGCVLFVVARKLLERDSVPGGRLDIFGAVASTLGMVALVFGITRAGEYGWIEGWTLASLAAGVAVLAIFMFFQKRSTHPILPIGLLKSRIRAGAYTGRILFTAAMFGFFFLTTQTLQNEMRFTAVQAGMGFLPMTVMTFLASLTLPRLTQLIGNGGVLALSFACSATALFWLSFADASDSYVLAVGLPMLVLGVGNGTGLAPLTVAGVQGVAAAEAGAASGLINSVHQLGGSLGVAGLASFAATRGISSGIALAAVLHLAGLVITLILIVRPRPNQTS